MKNIKIPVAEPALIGKEKKYVIDSLDSNWISCLGKYIDKFENKFARYLNIKHAATCSNGTVALHLALLALDIKPGDEVICPTFTYVATANSIKYVGAEPVFVDCEPDTFNIDPEKIEKKINKKTKAIMVVPIYGHPCDYDKIIQIANKYGLFIIEDAAEAIGAEYKGKKCGTFGHINTFSFFANKTLTTGEGGMIVTNNSQLDEKVRFYKGQGMDIKKRYWFKSIGYNYRMTNIQAAIGLAQLENIKKHLSKRKKIAKLYNKYLKNITEIQTPIEKYGKHSFWIYSILVKNRADRDKLMLFLTNKGIETRPFFYPMHTMPVYDYVKNKSQLKTSEIIASMGISLPTFYNLKEKEIIYISNQIKNFYK